MTRFLKATEIGTGGASTLPGRYFTSPEIFELEQERIFQRRWLCAGRAEQISQPGDFILRSIGTESVIILRDSSGEVRAFHNLCRHRGTRLCTEPSGRLANTIQCPYHAWTYALDGRLIGAPSIDGQDGFDKSDFPLLKVAVALWEGFIFISLNPNPRAFSEDFAPFLGKFPHYNLARLRSARQIEYDLQANWKLIFQNYSECYHCPSVHPRLVKLSPADSGRNDLINGPILGGYMLVPSGGSMTMTGKACSIPVGDLSDEECKRVYYYAIFPNMLLSLHHDYVMVHTIWPTSSGRTVIECNWLFHPEAASRAGFHPEDGIQFWDMTNREDWHMCELSQLGVASRAYAPGPYSARESLSAAFDREVVAALEKNVECRSPNDESTTKYEAPMTKHQ